jgi:hypothetical protein
MEKMDWTITHKIGHLYGSIWKNRAIKKKSKRIGGVMVSVLPLSAVDRGFEPKSGKAKHYKIAICCFSDKHAALRRKSRDWLAWNQDNVFE